MTAVYALRRLIKLSFACTSWRKSRESDPTGMVKWQGKDALTPGKHTVEFDWKYDIRDWARAAPARSRWTARPWIAIRWRTVWVVVSHGPRRSVLELIPAPQSTRKTIKCRSRLLAS